MFGQSPRSTIEELVQESMLGIIKSKTGIKKSAQIKCLEFITTFKKDEVGVIRINSIYLKYRMKAGYSRISLKEIKFSGATSSEFVTYLRHCGARQTTDKIGFLERI